MTNMGKCACDKYTASLSFMENENIDLYTKLKILKNVKSQKE